MTGFTKITVTQRDIDRPGDPVFGTLSKLLDGMFIVLSQTVYLGDGIHVRLPPIAVDFIRDFDAGREVFPFSFWLPVS